MLVFSKILISLKIFSLMDGLKFNNNGINLIRILLRKYFKELLVISSLYLNLFLKCLN